MDKKKAFKMPHLLWIMTGIILISCLATYLIPAGQFAANEAGEIIGSEFQYLGYQTPVSPWDAMMLMKSGMIGAATIMFVVMISGANINVVIETGVLFAKKLRLDPICALGVTTFASLIGFGTGPAQQATTQMLMGVTPYSAFFTRLLIMNFSWWWRLLW